MTKYLLKITESGFTIIELMISMALLSFVMGISMNILSIVLEMTNDADYSVVLTQESNYASERVKRLVRSADSFSVANDILTLNLDTNSYTLAFVGPDLEGCYVLKENTTSSVMSSEVCVKPFELNGVFEPFWELILDEGDPIGVRMAFKVFHKRDENGSAGAFVYSQAIGRNKVLN